MYAPRTIGLRNRDQCRSLAHIGRGWRFARWWYWSSLSLSLSVTHSQMSLYVSLCISISPSLSVSIISVCISRCRSLALALSLALCLSVCLSLTLSLSRVSRTLSLSRARSVARSLTLLFCTQVAELVMAAEKLRLAVEMLLRDHAVAAGAQAFGYVPGGGGGFGAGERMPAGKLFPILRCLHAELAYGARC
jgi:hypothetical protein